MSISHWCTKILHIHTVRVKHVLNRETWLHTKLLDSVLQPHLQVKSIIRFTKIPKHPLMWLEHLIPLLLLCCYLTEVHAGFRKGRGTRDQIDNNHWIIEKAREFQKSIYFCFIDYAKAFDCVDHNKLWKILKDIGIPDHLIHLLRNLYAGQEATVRTGHGTTTGSK